MMSAPLRNKTGLLQQGENHVAPSLPPRDTYIHLFQMILSLFWL